MTAPIPRRTPMQKNRTYEAVAYRDGNWWTFEIPELSTTINGTPTVAMGQARTIAEIDQAALDVAALWLDVDEDSVAVNVTIVEADGKP